MELLSSSVERRTDKILYIARLIDRLDRVGSATVLRYDDVDLTAEALLASIFRYARAISSIGIGPSSLVALLAPNHPSALAIRYAAHLVGAAATYLSIPPAEGARAALLAQVAPDLLVVYPETAPLVPVSAGMEVVTVGDTGNPALIRLDELAAEQVDGPVACRAQPDDLGVVVSSGGSTGVPKGSWRTFSAYSAMVDVPSAPDRRQLINARLAYLSQVLVDVTLLGGGLVVLQDGFDPVDTLATIERERITDLFLVEPQLFELMDDPDVTRRDLTSLRTLTHIGASAPPLLRRRARERLGPVIAHTYGASEMGLVSLLSPADYDLSDVEAYSSAGRIHPTVRVRFRRDDGSLAKPQEGGCIEVRSPALAGGYMNRPDLTAAAFHEGWYRTGDLGRTDAVGRLHILGRAVDIIRVAGLALTPTMIEDILCRVPTVRYAVVVVEQAAQTWTAAVEAWPGSAVDATGSMQAVAGALGPEAASRLCIVPLARIPRTGQGKPNREAIRAVGSEMRLRS